MIPTEHYNGKTILYCANYINEDSEMLNYNDSKILNLYQKGLSEINPNFDLGNIENKKVQRMGFRLSSKNLGCKGLVVRLYVSLLSEDLIIPSIISKTCIDKSREHLASL